MTLIRVHERDPMGVIIRADYVRFMEKSVWFHWRDERHLVVSRSQGAKIKRLLKAGCLFECGDRVWISDDADRCPHCHGGEFIEGDYA